ncbi:ABC transporter ATP-binding protein [Pseudomonas wenzhouensis]|uniref:ABC transporter ATP-binding protein n=1 Tax=Pseudomonas wenzhouensis TaxID=2906062 RepID=UPI001E5801D6|nr:ABC transporter ATP-binding protein [Pseudomonas wenzhouensis]UFQ98956.1 ABC transporter ATP-binding protein [Pseudomonas wenzhouensis]
MSTARELEFNNVSVHYANAPGDGWVVRDASLKIEAGDFVSLVGPSGCGKTTLLKLAAGMSRPTRGEVLFGGAPITGPDRERGVVFQEYGVFPWLSVRENVEFGLTLNANKALAAQRHEIAERYLQIMGLSDFAGSLPSVLSGGMRQRLALARAYAVDPACLLMDEPFAALDAQTRQVMHDLLLKLQQEEAKTALLITHSVEEALYLSNKIVLVSARPARITEVIEVPFGYPRNQALMSRPDFVELRAYLREKVMQAYQQQQQISRATA